MSQVVDKRDMSASAMLRWAPQWRAALEEAGRGERGWELLCAEVERRARRAWGLDAPEGDAQVTALLDVRGLDESLWRDEHVLGWFHQGWSSVDRAKSFALQTGRHQAHVDITAPTQLYTPRWIADWMAHKALALAPPTDAAPTCVDPAMGGGQLLLAWLGALEPLAAGRGWGALELVRSISGVELDARAAHVARRAVALWLERRFGALDEAVEAELVARLEVGDGLARGRRSDVALSNPPYMGLRAMPTALRAQLAAGWAPYHMDLCAAFARRCHALAGCAVGLLIQQAFWFLSRFGPARDGLSALSQLREVAHLGARVFPGLSGEKASVMATIHEVGAARAGAAKILDLRGEDAQAARARLARWEVGEEVAGAYEVEPAMFEILPGEPLAYWLPGALIARFRDGARLGDVAHVPGALNKTSDNARFVKRWDEVEASERAAAPGLRDGAEGGRWRFYSKGGRYAPWWGGWEHVVDWSEAARAHYATQRTASLMEPRWAGREGLCYTDFGGSRFNARWLPESCICDMTGPGIFVDLEDEDARREQQLFLLAVLNSAPARMMLNALNPTLHYQVRDVRNLPLPDLDAAHVREVAAMARALVEGWREAHRWVEGDPLYDGRGGAGLIEHVSALEEAERALHRRVCALYGVEELGEAELPAHKVALMARGR